MTDPEAPAQVSPTTALSPATHTALNYVGLAAKNTDESTQREGRPALSMRARRKEPTNPVMVRLGEMMSDSYREDNPNGIISLGVAENSLMAKELTTFYTSAFSKFFRPADLTYGDSLFASQRLTGALSGNSYFRPAYPIERSHIATGNGVYGTMNNLLDVLLDPGEAILISAPHYLGFDAMCTKRCGGVLVGVPMDIDENGWETEGDVAGRMERAWEECQGKGISVKVIIVTNPGNPIGRTLSRDTLLAYCRFAEEHNLHLISDEIYALSVFDNPQIPNAESFTSILSIDTERELGKDYSKGRLHVIHGMSKDFCSNGLRFGSLISQHNPDVLRAVMSLALFMKVSSATDTLFYALLSSPAPEFPSEEASDRAETIKAIHAACDAIDASRPMRIEDSFASWFVTENRRRLTDSAAYMTNWFETRGFKVYPANAGHFLWVDFGDRIGWDTWDRELDGFNEVFNQRVYIAPGSVFHPSRPGKMRVSFTVDRVLMDKGLARLDAYLKQVK
ncbi:hypothetical protein NCC49_003954 [Naganishia albida]|nr:hypothetical protein NCC49_003954 [Naganishia albida]